MSQPITSSPAPGSEISQTALMVSDQPTGTQDISKSKSGLNTEKPTESQAETSSEISRGSMKDKKARLALLIHQQNLAI
ncbi:hypothetical protein [Endozoicomonas euniceicola]|uniref:Uncharacterized protein n=1 Tax=Endozoicomonas euniceicola TaxID=1234143 RepID=A0ABY6H299_9GAMM|nr:hypothetical protein [Endozoicomonas euniceicola]UYM18343.1 hypothetical protein NX720_10680 [Endozoicomonas euniceicola]